MFSWIIDFFYLKFDVITGKMAVITEKWHSFLGK